MTGIPGRKVSEATVARHTLALPSGGEVGPCRLFRWPARADAAPFRGSIGGRVSATFPQMAVHDEAPALEVVRVARDRGGLAPDFSAAQTPGPGSWLAVTEGGPVQSMTRPASATAPGVDEPPTDGSSLNVQNAPRSTR